MLVRKGTYKDFIAQFCGEKKNAVRREKNAMV